MFQCLTIKIENGDIEVSPPSTAILGTDIDYTYGITVPNDRFLMNNSTCTRSRLYNDQYFAGVSYNLRFSIGASSLYLYADVTEYKEALLYLVNEYKTALAEYELALTLTIKEIQEYSRRATNVYLDNKQMSTKV